MTALHDINGQIWPSCDGGTKSLTQREREVMALVVMGLLNKQIAAQLHTSEATIKAHRAQLMRKIEAGTPSRS